MFARAPESLRRQAQAQVQVSSSLGVAPGEPRGKGPLKTAPARGGGTLAVIHLCGRVHTRARSTEALTTAPAPAPADVIRSQGPSQLLGRYVPFVPRALAAQSSWDSCPA